MLGEKVLHENVSAPQLRICSFLSFPFEECFDWPEAKHGIWILTRT